MKRINLFINSNFSDKEISNTLNIKSNRDWDLSTKRNEIIKQKNHNEFIKIVEYKPFSKYYCYYNVNAHDYHRYDLMKHMFQDNYLFMSSRNSVGNDFKNVFITKYLGDIHTVSDQTYAFPLYLYPEKDEQQNMLQIQERTPNLNPEIVKEISEKLNLTFTNEKEETEGTFAPIDLLDYIYSVLHSPNYREKYKEFLKIDFPRIPYPADKEIFWKLVALGSELRQIHLLESSKVEQYITTYPEDGDNKITRKITKNDFELIPPENEFGKVWINKEQYFDNVPLAAWEFYIGGYQPAQKWLKDRNDRELSFDEILHYQKIIVALTETDRVMKEIDALAEF